MTTEYDETNEADEFIHRDYVSAPLIKRSTTFIQHILLALHTDTVKVVIKVFAYNVSNLMNENQNTLVYIVLKFKFHIRMLRLKSADKKKINQIVKAN